jgi:chitodextrinase
MGCQGQLLLLLRQWLVVFISLFILLGCGEGDGSDSNETDQTAPTKPANLVTSNITHNSLTLAWDPSTDNVETTGYRVLRDDTEIATTPTNSYSDSGLAPATQYRYRVIAYDAAGNESPSSDEAVQTTASIVDTEAPSVPTGLAAGNITSSSISLTWAASTDNTATTGYRIFRDGQEAGTSITTSYVDSGLSPNTPYQYTVSAYDGAGNESAQSTSLNASTAAAVAGSCGTQTGSVVALPFKFVLPQNVGKYVTLAATSTLVEYILHTHEDAPDINWSRRYKPYKYGDGGGAVTVWRLDTPPANGILYEGTTALAQDDTISDPDDLFYVPNSDFIGEDSFTYCAADATGLSNVAEVSLQVADPANYPMPVGVTDPGFGINETPPDDPASWPGAETAGYYYIDSDDPACSDNNSYGFPDLPRCSFPANGSTIAAGAKLVLAPSTQPLSLRDSGWHQINFDGTSGSTSWLIGDEQGPGKPIIVPHANQSGEQLRITGSHLRISGVVFDRAMPRHMGGGADNVVLRHSEITNNPSTGGGGTSVSLSTGGSNVLAFNVYAHDNGIVEADGLSRERDIHAFIGTNQQGYWLLDNRCDENAGDCIQLGNNNTSSDVFIGRLVSHSEGENCIDIKDFNRVVVSESDCWDLRRVAYGNSGGNAQNFYVNDEGIQQNYVYFLNNRSWDTGGSNFATSNLSGHVYFIGNVSFSTPAGSGLNFGGGGGGRYVFFNTFSDSEIGMYLFGSGSAMDRYIGANIVDGASLYQTRLRSASSVIRTLDYNFYTDDGGDFASGGSTPVVYSGLNAFRDASGFSQNSAEGVTAGFMDDTIYDFRLSAGSALIDSVPAAFIAAQPILSNLTNDLGISLTDIAGTDRPQGSDYEPGAFSYKP